VKIDDIIKNRKTKPKKATEPGQKKKSGEHSIQRTTFNIQESGGNSGKASTKKEKGEKQEKIKVTDPNFWEKVMPFEGYNPK